MNVPKYDEMYGALISALHNLGGSSSISEMEEQVAKILRLRDEEINEIHRGNRTKFSYRLAWTRNYLKRYGILENSSRGVWTLTDKGLKTNEVDKEEVNSFVKNLDKKESSSLDEEIEEKDKSEEDVLSWEDLLLEKLKEMDPSAFERLCQRILRESGFVEVSVLGRSGDGGIDGKGILRLEGLIGFRVVFQCKRWQGNVPSKEIRDFRGAMDGKADRGLFITTSKFTRDAIGEASRDGAFPVDLVDGVTLANKIKELGLGVKVIAKEEVEIIGDWFDKI